MIVVAVLWGATLVSGVHPSLAGMATGLLVPATTTHGRHVEAAKRLIRDYWQSHAPVRLDDGARAAALARACTLITTAVQPEPASPR